MLVTKFSIEKSKRCTTAWLNLRTLLGIQFFHILSHVWEQRFDPREGLCCVFTVKNVPLRNFLTYMDVFAWKCSHRSTCLHTICHTISYVVLDRHVSTKYHITVFWLATAPLCRRTCVQTRRSRQTIFKKRCLVCQTLCRNILFGQSNGKVGDTDMSLIWQKRDIDTSS